MEGDTPNLGNSVEMFVGGTSIQKDEVIEETPYIKTNTSAQGSDWISVKKMNGDYAAVLSGAEFTIYQAELDGNGQYILGKDVNSFSSGEDGMAYIWNEAGKKTISLVKILHICSRRQKRRKAIS